MAQSGLAAAWCTTASSTFGSNAGFSQVATLIAGQIAPGIWPWGLFASISRSGAASANVAVSASILGGAEASDQTRWLVGSLGFPAQASSSATAIGTALNPPLPPVWGVRVTAQATGAATVTFFGAVYIPLQ